MTVRNTRKPAGPHRRMPAQDSLWLHLDRPENLMVVTSVLWTRTPVDVARLRSLVSDRLLARYPVYLQRAVRHGRTVSWETDPGFDLGNHVVEHDALADRAALEEFVAVRRSTSFDLKRPLWTIELLRGYRGGSALVCRTHHAMADGIRLTQVLFGLLDPADGGSAAPHAKVGGVAPHRDVVAQPVVRLGGRAAHARRHRRGPAAAGGPRASRAGDRRVVAGARRDRGRGRHRSRRRVPGLGTRRRPAPGGRHGRRRGDDGLAQCHRDRGPARAFHRHRAVGRRTGHREDRDMEWRAGPAGRAGADRPRNRDDGQRRLHRARHRSARPVLHTASPGPVRPISAG
jgi:hypothetical protein